MDAALDEPATPGSTCTAKSTPRPGRKMGHLTVLGDDVDEVADAALRLRAACGPRNRTPPPTHGRPRCGDAAAAGTDRARRAASCCAVTSRDDVDALQAVIEVEPRAPAPVHAVGRPGSATRPPSSSPRSARAGRPARASTTSSPSPATPADGERLLGGCGLHRRGGPESLEIGYWLRPDAVGRGVMTAAAGALTDGRLRHRRRRPGRDPLRRGQPCAARRSPRRLGYRHVGDEDHEPDGSRRDRPPADLGCVDAAVVGAAVPSP